MRGLIPGRILAWCLAALAGASGCSAQADPTCQDADTCGKDGGTSGVDRSDEFFDRAMHDIDIQMSEAAWDSLRNQYKTRHTIFGTPNCRDAPVANPYTYFRGDMTINGEELIDVGFRKKAHLGSQSTIKPGLKVRFDRSKPEQNFFSLDRIALNNSKSDPAYVKQCLSYKVFAQAGLPAPRCTYASVTVNGDYKGVYVALEEIKEPFLERHYSSSSGTLYEGTASDFRPEFIGGYEQENNKSIDDSRADLTRIYDVVQTAPDEDFISELGALVDLDNFFTHWAAETLVWHRDGYSGNANNHFWYANPSNDGKFELIAWGTDATFRPNTRASAGVPDSVQASGIIANRLYNIDEGRRRYYTELDRQLDSVWDAADLVATIEAQADAIRSRVDADEVQSFEDEIAELKTFVEGHEGKIRTARSDGEPTYDADMRVLPCRTLIGKASGTFETTWDSLAEGAFDVGNSTLTIEDGQTVLPEFEREGVRAGLHANGSERILMILENPGSRRYNVTVVMPDKKFFEEIQSAGDYPLLAPPFTLAIVEQDRSVSPIQVLRRMEVGEGTFSVTSMDTQPGGLIKGSFSGGLYLSP